MKNNDNNLIMYLPENNSNIEVKFIEEYNLVVQRINKIIPDDLVWTFYSSQPEETGGVINFPYLRVDNQVLCAKDNILMLNKNKDTQDEINKWYKKSCIQTFQSLLWIDVGFLGLENFAKSKASRNWTNSVGHFINDEERAIKIMTDGKKFFDNCLSVFTQFRKNENITNDYFSQYKAEYLLDSYL